MKKLALLLGVYVLGGSFVTGFLLLGIGMYRMANNQPEEWYMLHGFAFVLCSMAAVVAVGIGCGIRAATIEILKEDDER